MGGASESSMKTSITSLPPAGSRTAAQAPGDDRPLRLLTVSSRPGTVAYLGHLVRLGHTQPFVYEECDRLATALKRVLRGGLDLILLDLTLRDADGLKALAELSTAAPQIPLVILADQDAETAAIEAVRQGAQDYLLREQLTPGALSRAVRCAIERHRHLLTLRDLSLTDPLTGLYNRRGFYAVAEAQIRMARRGRHRCLLVCADLDGLKEINDRHGHQAGDRAILEAALILRSCFRDTDVIARFGGDEFVAMAYDVSPDAEQVLLTRVDNSFKAANGVRKQDFQLTLSVGTLGFAGAESVNIGQLMDRADRALYREKRRRNSGPHHLIPGGVPAGIHRSAAQCA